MSGVIEELSGYPKENWDWNRLTATRKIICDWVDRYVVYQSYVGADYPYDPVTGFNASGAYCTGGTIEPLEAKGLGANDIAIYEKALITLEYRVPDPETGTPIREEGVGPTAALGSDSFSSNTEFLTLDHTDFQWATGTKPLKPKEAPAKLIFSLNWTRTLENVVTPIAGGLGEVILENIGSVNDLPINAANTAGFTFPAETLLYTKPTINKQGANSARVTLNFVYRPQGWNKFYRADIERFDIITFRNGIIFKTYKPKSFTGFNL